MTDWFRRLVDEALRTLSPVKVAVGREGLQEALRDGMSRDMATLVLLLDEYQQVLASPPADTHHLECFETLLMFLQAMMEAKDAND